MERNIMVRRASLGEAKADIVLKNGNVVNVFTNEVIVSDVAIVGEKIVGVGLGYAGETEIDCTDKFILPGFIDSHIHIESTLATPYELAKEVVKKGTTTCIADPHELVNVGGASALEWILEATVNTPISYKIMIPSSVPATQFDTNGAGKFTAENIKAFLNHQNVLGLGEVMCFNDVFANNAEILDKLDLFKNMPIDGHAPNISERQAGLYLLSGVMTDHESTTFEEAQMKLRAGLYILIREGSGAQNLEAIVSGIVNNEYTLDRCAFCTDDKHLEDICTLGHVNHCVNKAIEIGADPIDAIKAASYNASKIYGLNDRGAICVGLRADIIICDSIVKIEPELVLCAGKIVDDDFLSSFKNYPCPSKILDTIRFNEFGAEQLKVKANEKNHIIGAIKNQLLTKHLFEVIPSEMGYFKPSSEYSKLCVIERHGKTTNIGVAPLKGFGIVNGAVATSVSHDSHNLIVVGDNDEDIIIAAEHIRAMRGGFAVASNKKIVADLPLEICGLISTLPSSEVQARAHEVIKHAKALGVADGIDPIVNLSFMALPVIPSIRLLDTGLFDVEKFKMITDNDESLN